ncbi:MAG: AmmeMemoRadiSam system protein B [Bdellovibrionales bacterium]|nr:AmmeMemoRadiSam system protein B [Bdellovibrionales bacterium]
MKLTRHTAVAGRFYPADPHALETQLEEWFASAGRSETVRTALIAPHAGYVYSGATAAKAYACSRIPNSVVILCPNHTGEGPRLSIWGRGGWQTPLGDIEIDEALAAKLVATLPDLTPDETAHRYEHAIEVHLPFLRFLNPDVRIVPIVVGPLNSARSLAIGSEMGKVLATEHTRPLLVASTDMSHYVPASVAEQLDRLALGKLSTLDPAGLYQTVSDNGISMCGFIPTVITIQAAIELGATHCHLIEYTNSGVTSGDYDSVVGYAAAYID